MIFFEDIDLSNVCNVEYTLGSCSLSFRLAIRYIDTSIGSKDKFPTAICLC